MNSQEYYLTGESRTIQPYFVLSTKSIYLKKSLSNSPISHFYSFIADADSPTTLALPDGSIDLLFLCNPENPTAKVCGSTRLAREINIQKNQRYFGVRFRSGCFPDFLPLSAKELLDTEIDLLSLGQHYQRIIEQLSLSPTFEQKIALFLSSYGDQLLRKQSDLCYQLNGLICQHHGNIRIQELELQTQYSSRYINKVFLDNFGLTPKLYCLILRFQQALFRLTRSDRLNLVNLALVLGYADQSHFLREFKRFAAVAPKRFSHEMHHAQYQQRLALFS